jgi:5-methylcytosine-specific restriction endonuclease McrA
MAQCAHCGNEYTKQDRARYCSTKCRGAAKRKKRHPYRCLSCGVEFTVVPSRTKQGTPKYCSAPCKYAHFKVDYRTRVAKLCPMCGLTFETKLSDDNTYCSYTCMGKGKERKEDRQCVVCSEIFRIKRSSQDICCSWECRIERLRGENHPSWRGGTIRSYAGDWTRQKREARARDDNICQECGKTSEENGANMSVHHIKPYRAFDDPHEANRLENLISLCMSCHMKKPE